MADYEYGNDVREVAEELLGEGKTVEVKVGDLVRYKNPKSGKTEDFMAITVNPSTHITTIKDDNGNMLDVPMAELKVK